MYNIGVTNFKRTNLFNGIKSIKEHIENIFITVGYKGPILAKHVIEHNVDVIFNTEGKDNAWWIYNTLLSHLDEPIFVLTCDNVTKINCIRLYINGKQSFTIRS